MTRALLAGLLAATMLSGCKIVPKVAETVAGGDGAAAAPADHVGQVVQDTYESQLVPFVTQKAVDVAELKPAIADGLEAAGAAHGNQAAGGGAWNFVAKGGGTVVAADRESRAATLDVDVDGDGTGDVQIQLGPVVKGTALRDVAPFYDFTAFKDQIEFAALARALNTRATEAIQLPEGDLKGRHVSFEGAFALRSASEPIQIVPTKLTVESGS